MKNIIFSRNLSNITIDAGNAACVYHKKYANCLPKVANCEFIEFNYLCDNFQKHDFFKGKDTVVFVGANKLFTPSTRFHPVFDILQYNLDNMQRYSLDIAPYIGPIWRLWAHFSFAGVPYGEYTYSYLLETHYNGYIEGKRTDNPMSIENIRQYAKGHVQIDYDRYFSEPVIETIVLPEYMHEEYQQLKAELFDTCSTIGPIISGLSNYAKKCCKECKIPQESKMFETPDNIKIVRTDLKVDEYLTNKLLDKISEVNKVSEVLYHDSL